MTLSPKSEEIEEHLEKPEVVQGNPEKSELPPVETVETSKNTYKKKTQTNIYRTNCGGRGEGGHKHI